MRYYVSARRMRHYVGSSGGRPKVSRKGPLVTRNQLREPRPKKTYSYAHPTPVITGTKTCTMIGSLIFFGNNLERSRHMSGGSADYDYIFKVVIVGDSGVGKSTMLIRFVDEKFVSDYNATIGVDYRIKTVRVQQDGHRKVVKLSIWDSAGQEQYNSIAQSYYRGSQGILVLYDTTSRESFENLQNWLDRIYSDAGESVIRIMVGTKSDLVDQRKVSTDEAEHFAKERGIIFLETSSKNGENVERAFVSLTQEMLSTVAATTFHTRPPAAVNTTPPTPEKRAKRMC